MKGPLSKRNFHRNHLYSYWPVRLFQIERVCFPASKLGVYRCNCRRETEKISFKCQMGFLASKSLLLPARTCFRECCGNCKNPRLLNRETLRQNSNQPYWNSLVFWRENNFHFYHSVVEFIGHYRYRFEPLDPSKWTNARGVFIFSISNLMRGKISSFCLNTVH